jgi:lysyl-tRNA synthetase, class II
MSEPSEGQEVPPSLEEPEAGGRLEEVLRARRDALKRLRDNGIEPFALRYDKDADAAELHTRFGHLSPGEGTDEHASVAGRVMLLRKQGKLSFISLRDRSGDIQLFLKEDVLGPSYGLVDLLDLGDVVGARGEVMKTKRGELSVQATELVLLTKALRPLPEKWHGLRDPELRFRQRYLEFATNQESRRIVSGRAQVLKAFRRVLEDRGYVEVETPVLQKTHGGALARPFVTHHRALDLDLYLRIAPELFLKRLLVGGLERVYEIGRDFRNEGIDRDHNPEFTMLEAYQAYGTYEDMMDLAEALIREAAMAVRGSLRFVYQGRDVDLESPWRRVTLAEAVSEVVGEAVPHDDLQGVRAVASRAGVEVNPSWGPGKVLLEVFEKRVEHDIWNPTFVKDFPREVSPLARPHRSEPGLTEQFDLIICGMEIGPAYSELTDPDEQRARFMDQQRMRRTGDEEAHPVDEEFLEALEHGMPPAGGIGLGVDRLLKVVLDAPNLREVILFPHLRPEGSKG